MKAPRPRTRVLIAAALAAAAVVLVLALSVREDRRAGGPTGEPAGPARGARVERAGPWLAPPGGAVDPWRIGARRVYAADFSSSLEANRNEPNGWFSLAGSASLALTVVKADAASVVLRGTLSRLSLVLENDEHAGRHVEETIDGQLRPPFEITMSRSGQVESLAADTGTTGMAHGLLRVLAAAVQFVRPDHSGETTWTVEEPDENGVCRVHYQQIAPGVFEKTKGEYTLLEIADKLGIAGTRARPTISGKATVTLRGPDGLGPSGRDVVGDVQSQERLVLPIGANGFKVETHVALHWQSTEMVEEIPALAGPLVASPLRMTREGRQDPAEALAARRKLVGGKSLDQLLTDLKQLSAGQQEERLELMRRLTALFDTDPGSVIDAVAALSRAPSGNDRDILLGALAASSDPGAQRGVAELAANTDAEIGLRSGALTHLALEQHPTAETFRTLGRLAGDTNDPTRAAAVLALGGAARQGGGTPDTAAAAEEAVDQLQQGLRDAKSTEDRRLFLGAMGNGGSARSLADIKASLSDADPGLRAAAVDALRFIGSDEVDPLLANVMLHDASASVRGSAVGAAKYRSLSPVLEAAAEQTLKTEQRESIRIDVVEWLAEHLRDSPGPLAALQQTARGDASEEVRQTASKALGATGLGSNG